jgi:hypothetical protein
MNSDDYETCTQCTDIFETDDEGTAICSCYSGRWCSPGCAKTGGYVESDPGNDGESSCKYCRYEDLLDNQLLQWLLARNGWTRDHAIKVHNEEVL